MPRPGRIYFSVAQIASVMGWPVYYTRRWLKKHDALIRRGRFWFTTRGLLRRRFPEEWDEILAELPE